MAGKITLEIVTPYGSVFEAAVDEVTVVGSEGEFGVLEGHAPFVTTLGIGMLAARDESSTSYFFVNAGYADVGADRVLILAEAAEPSDGIDLERAQAARERAEQRLKQAAKVDFARAQAALDRSVTRINVSVRK